jgi:hypothetical protein
MENGLEKHRSPLIFASALPIDAPYRSGPHSAWIKVRNPTSIAVQRDRSENWNK